MGYLFKFVLNSDLKLEDLLLVLLVLDLLSHLLGFNIESSLIKRLGMIQFVGVHLRVELS